MKDAAMTQWTETTWTRRQLLARAGGGFGAVSLAALLSEEGLLSRSLADERDWKQRALQPMAPVAPHFPPRAKRVIWLFINGGPSHVDTWDYKPALNQWDGKSIREFDPTSRTRPASSRTPSAT